MPIDVQEATPQSEELAPLLAFAKRKMEAGQEEPIAILERDAGVLAEIRLLQFGDWNNPDVREHTGRVLRALVADPGLRISRVAMALDGWLTTIAPEALAAGLDPMNRDAWSEADRAKYVVRREALMLSIEARGGAPFIIHQFYRRGAKGIVWEEASTFDGGAPGAQVSGRLMNLFPRAS
jgi:hypothetical protein